MHGPYKYPYVYSCIPFHKVPVRAVVPDTVIFVYHPMG